jgi:Uma2 family endonuclease
MPQVEQEKSEYSYQDYLTWPDDERWELIEGHAYAMTPAPSVKHQRVTARLYARLEANLEGTGCIPFIAPTDVVLSNRDVVQPDVFVVCEEVRITEANIQGAPDVVAEVTSTASARKDRREKKALYARFGIKEYLLVDPDGQYVERFLLESDGTYSKGQVFGPQDVLTLSAVEGVEIALWEVFEARKPEDRMKEL